MELQEKLLKIIKKENKKRPLTDIELSKKLNISREYVTRLRKEMDIKPSSKRLLNILRKEIEIITAQNPDISMRNLTEEVNKKGFNVSRYIVNREYKNIKSAVNTEEVNTEKVNSNNVNTNNNDYNINSKDVNIKKVNNPFYKLIGHDKSIKSQIEQAKAAVLYPPRGLHTLILGESGVGKSLLAQLMYEFALENEKVEYESFVSFNCADYAENPQLLFSQLFGYVRGAFTGADRDKAGLIEQANGGILFLDEIHRLPASGQEMLFNVIDNGKYRKLGESEKEHDINVMIIAATTEEIKSSLLATFRRRIPMIIKLPPLRERNLQDKLNLLKVFISQESRRIQRSIVLNYEAGRALLSYNPVNNIGELENDIKVICARAYLSHMTGEKNIVEISFGILPVSIKESFLEESFDRDKIRSIIKKDIVISPDKFLHLIDEKSDINIYRYIENKINELEDLPLNDRELTGKLMPLIEEKLKNMFNQTDFNRTDKKSSYSKVIGEELLSLIDEMFIIAQQEIPELVLKSRLKYALGLHIKNALERLRKGKTIIYPDLNKVKSDYSHFFKVALTMVEKIEEKFELVVPEEEAGFITLYLKTLVNFEKSKDRKKIGIIVMTHGYVASEMLKVANWMLGGSHAKALDMDLENEPQNVLKELIPMVKEVNEGRGVLLMVDMGSLSAFGKIVSEKTGVNVKVITGINTFNLMRAIRWSVLNDMTLDSIIDRLKGNLLTGNNEKNNKYLLIFCLTGKGIAIKVKEFLQDLFPNLEKKYNIINYGIASEKDEIYNIISKIEKKGELTAVIGNLKPRLLNKDKFFYINDILAENELERFKKITDLNFNKNEAMFSKLFKHNLIFPELSIQSKEEAVNILGKKLKETGAVKDGFIRGINERENMGVTYVGSGIVFPHTFDEYINYSQIAFAKLKQAVKWGDYEVNIICMLALKDLDVENFKTIYANLSKNLDKIKNSKTAAGIKEALINENQKRN